MESRSTLHSGRRSAFDCILILELAFLFLRLCDIRLLCLNAIPNLTQPTWGEMHSANMRFCTPKRSCRPTPWECKGSCTTPEACSKAAISPRCNGIVRCWLVSAYDDHVPVHVYVHSLVYLHAAECMPRCLCSCCVRVNVCMRALSVPTTCLPMNPALHSCLDGT